VINVDGHPAYASAIAKLKQTGELGRRCRCRTSSYMNNIIEQDHRFIKKRIKASLGFRSAAGASRTIEGYAGHGTPIAASNQEALMAKKSTSSSSKGKSKVHKVMKEHKKGTLKSGSGKKVKSRKQAVAIALSEARKSGAKIPKKKSKS
jgi:hypothetical protein